jgi:hypothetical protein
MGTYFLAGHRHARSTPEFRFLSFYIHNDPWRALRVDQKKSSCGSASFLQYFRDESGGVISEVVITLATLVR